MPFNIVDKAFTIVGIRCVVIRTIGRYAASLSVQGERCAGPADYHATDTRSFTTETSARLSYAEIARSLGLAKGSVFNYLARAESAGLTYEVAAALDDAALLSRLHPERYLYAHFAAPDFGRIHRELKRKGVTLTRLWEEYCEAAQGVPYSRSRFFERYQQFVDDVVYGAPSVAC